MASSCFYIPSSTSWGDTDVYPIRWDEDNQRWIGSSRQDESGNSVSLVWNASGSNWVEG